VVRLDGVQTEWPLLSKAIEQDGLTGREFNQFLSELVQRINFNQIELFDSVNPNTILTAYIGKQAQSTLDGDLWIKTTDGTNTGWVKVGTQS